MKRQKFLSKSPQCMVYGVLYYRKEIYQGIGIFGVLCIEKDVRNATFLEFYNKEPNGVSCVLDCGVFAIYTLVKHENIYLMTFAHCFNGDFRDEHVDTLKNIVKYHKMQTSRRIWRTYYHLYDIKYIFYF